MSYYMTQRDTDFYVEAKHAEEAADKLGEAYFSSAFDQGGNIIYVDYNGERYADEIFDSLKEVAPFVKNGSYIEFSGESGDIWRWTFYGGKCYEMYPEIIWPDYIVAKYWEVTDTVLAQVTEGALTNPYNESQSEYINIISKFDDDASTISIQITKETDGLPQEEWHYSIHLVDNITDKPCELYHSDDLEESNLQDLIIDIIENAEAEVIKHQQEAQIAFNQEQLVKHR